MFISFSCGSHRSVELTTNYFVLSEQEAEDTPTTSMSFSSSGHDQRCDGTERPDSASDLPRTGGHVDLPSQFSGPKNDIPDSDSHSSKSCVENSPFLLSISEGSDSEQTLRNKLGNPPTIVSNPEHLGITSARSPDDTGIPDDSDYSEDACGSGALDNNQGDFDDPGDFDDDPGDTDNPGDSDDPDDADNRSSSPESELEIDCMNDDVDPVNPDNNPQQVNNNPMTTL